MKFNLDENLDGFAVTAYAENWVRIGDQRLESPCVVSADGIILDLLPPNLDALTIEHFDDIIPHRPEIILLGTGAQQIFPDYAIVTALAARQIALEVMDTGAACRSYNILLAESRAVVAALYMI